MGIFSVIAGDAQDFKNRLATDAGHLLSEFEALWDKMVAVVSSDAGQVAQDAETAAAPVVAEAEKDAADVAAQAVAGVEAVVEPNAPTA